VFNLAYDREKLFQKLTFALAMNPNITMTELAKQAEISRASLNRIYLSKENLQEIILEEVKKIYSDISKILLKEHKNFIDDLKKLIKIFCENRNFILFICRDIFTDKIDSQVWQKHEEELTKFFSDGQNQGVLNKNFSAEIIANIFLGNVTWLLAMQAEKNNISIEDLPKVILQTFLGGIGEKNIDLK
jgi:AcrR family transcriptional regulator